MIAIAVTASIAFLSGLFVAAVAWGPLERRAKVPQIRSSEPKEERYGHPFPPVSRILKALPEPPFPLQWESWVDRSDGAKLCIRLVDLTKPDEPLETRWVDLLNRPGRGTWRANLTEYRCIYGELFQSDCVVPVINWADSAIVRHDPTPRQDMDDYRLGRK